MSEESNKIERFYDSDFIKFVFTVEDGYLSNISIKVKEGAPYPKVDLGGTGKSNIWFGMLRENIEQGLFYAPSEERVRERNRERIRAKPIVGGEAIVAPQADRAGKPILECSKCHVELVEEDTCCGKKAKVLNCPECGGRFRKPIGLDVPKEGGPEGYEGFGMPNRPPFKKKKEEAM